MKKYILSICLLVLSLVVFGQQYTDSDSVFIYQKFVKYSIQNGSYKDINEPFIENYWNSNNEVAAKYYEKAAYIRSIPIEQRVIMTHYLEKDCKMRLHEWMYDNLETRTDTVTYFKVLKTSYGIPYSKLGIKKRTLYRYCSRCEYK